MVLSTHYRKDFGYTEDLVKKASARLNYMRASFSIFYNMNEEKSTEACAEVDDAIKELNKGFKEAMDDDFNTPLALTKLASTIDKLRTYAETHTLIGSNSKASAVKDVLSAAHVLGLLEKDTYKERLPDAAAALIKGKGEAQEGEKIRRSGCNKGKAKVRLFDSCGGQRVRPYLVQEQVIALILVSVPAAVAARRSQQRSCPLSSSACPSWRSQTV